MATTASSPAPSTSASATATAGTSRDKIRIGSRTIVCQDAELRGDITIGSGCILHPKCTIFAYLGPIVIGDNCIIEETVVILNRTKEPLVIGNFNLFEVGCRVESPSIGSYNTFEAKSKVPSTVTVSDYCTVSVGVTVLTEASATRDELDAMGWQEEATPVQDPEGPGGSQGSNEQASAEGEGPPREKSLPPIVEQHTDPPASTSQTPSQPESSKTILDHLPPYTVVYTTTAATPDLQQPEQKRRTWSGEGVHQQHALMVKHLSYLSEMLPKYNRLKLIV